MIMSDLSNVKTGMILGIRLTGVSVSRTANLVGILRIAMSNVITAYTNLGVKEDSRSITLDYTPADNVRDEYPPSEPWTYQNYSMRAACCEDIYGRVPILKPLVSEYRKRLE
ncbi:hypothetical protein TNCV_1808441 [Trichonephila clavipes]|nr:hypothetical protein TNCV_1808441 [Trichonephila clavipes]